MRVTSDTCRVFGLCEKKVNVRSTWVVANLAYLLYFLQKLCFKQIRWKSVINWGGTSQTFFGVAWRSFSCVDRLLVFLSAVLARWSCRVDLAGVPPLCVNLMVRAILRSHRISFGVRLFLSVCNWKKLTTVVQSFVIDFFNICDFFVCFFLMWIKK